MKYIKRDIESSVLSLSEEYSCIMLTGPRQVGKTTLLKKLAVNRHYVSLDSFEERTLAATDPALFLQIHPAPVFIDEVQYAPELFPYIKIAVDNGAAPGDFWLTGSQPFRLMELAGESLAGRAAILHIPPLSQHEIYGAGENRPLALDFEGLRARAKNGAAADIYGTYERIFKGSMPGFLSGKYKNRDVFYSSYVQTYIDRDVSDIVEKVDKLGFLDFIRSAACRTAQLLNVHAIAGDVGVSDDTAKRWLAVLEKSGVIFYLRSYSDNLLKRTVKAPKMYFFDTGLVAYLTKYSSAEILANGAISGAILENYAVAELIKSYRNAAKECYLYYYRDKDGREIDVVMEMDGKIHPVEIKRSINPGRELLKTFKALDSGRLERGIGAVLCLRGDLSAIDHDNFIVPIWMI